LPVQEPEHDRLAAVTSEGRLLVFPVSELPRLARGKGNKIIHIPAQRATQREELLVALAVIPAGRVLTLIAGKRTLALKPRDLDAYQGERGRRGERLPRVFQKISGMVVG
jgi:topoisomerase-4 subunit A